MAVFTSSVSAPAAAAPLPPTTNWGLDYGQTQCTAARSFGDPANPIVLGIVPSIGGETYKWVISVPKYGPAYARSVNASIRLDSLPLNGPLLHFGKSGVKMSIYQFDVSAAEMEKSANAGTLDVKANNGSSFNFALSNMPALIEQLRKCNADLQDYWNMGQQSTVSTAPVGDVRRVFRSDDYPTEALIRNQQGTSQFRLLVDDKGAVDGCEAFRKSGIAVLDVMGCQVILERAKFTPAKDASGKAVRSVVTTPPVVWRVVSDGAAVTLRPMSE